MALRRVGGGWEITAAVARLRPALGARACIG